MADSYKRDRETPLRNRKTTKISNGVEHGGPLVLLVRKISCETYVCFDTNGRLAQLFKHCANPKQTELLIELLSDIHYFSSRGEAPVAVGVFYTNSLSNVPEVQITAWTEPVQAFR